jgi:hypothetical protein
MGDVEVKEYASERNARTAGDRNADVPEMSEL